MDMLWIQLELEMIRNFLRIGSMFLTFKNSPKHK